jgi:hypothetical protein
MPNAIAADLPLAMRLAGKGGVNLGARSERVSRLDAADGFLYWAVF